MYGWLEEKRGLWMTNRPAHTEEFVMGVLMTTFLKGYLEVVFSFSLTSTPLCSRQRVLFVSYYHLHFQHNLECNCSIQQIKGWKNQMRIKTIMRKRKVKKKDNAWKAAVGEEGAKSHRSALLSRIRLGGTLASLSCIYQVSWERLNKGNVVMQILCGHAHTDVGSSAKCKFRDHSSWWSSKSAGHNGTSRGKFWRGKEVRIFWQADGGQGVLWGIQSGGRSEGACFYGNCIPASFYQMAQWWV